MRAIVVSAPDRTQWKVRVAWEPRWRPLARRFGGWRRKRRQGDIDAGDVIDGANALSDLTPSSRGGGGGGSGDGFDLGDAFIVILVVFFAVIAAAVLFWWVLLPLLLIAFDLVIVLALLIIAIAGRVLFRRPWTVEATAGDGRQTTAEVVGWRAALRRRDDIADSLRRGMNP